MNTKRNYKQLNLLFGSLFQRPDSQALMLSIVQAFGDFEQKVESKNYPHEIHEEDFETQIMSLIASRAKDFSAEEMRDWLAALAQLDCVQVVLWLSDQADCLSINEQNYFKLWALFELDELNDVIRFVEKEKVLSMPPNEQTKFYFYYYSKAKEKLGKKEEAKKVWEELVEKFPSFDQGYLLSKRVPK